jgi:hypothetical protein
MGNAFEQNVSLLRAAKSYDESLFLNRKTSKNIKARVCVSRGGQL